MKTLTLLRHAKSSWSDPATRDFDRALNARGKRAAEVMGGYARTEGLEFDKIIASPAVRVTETLDHFAYGYGRRLQPVWERRVYLSSSMTLLDIVHEVDDSVSSLLLVGHNPGMEDIVLELVPDRKGDALRDEVEEKYPTAALAQLQAKVESWRDFGTEGVTLARFVRPRDLRSDLGPDDD